MYEFDLLTCNTVDKTCTLAFKLYSFLMIYNTKSYMKKKKHMLH